MSGFSIKKPLPEPPVSVELEEDHEGVTIHVRSGARSQCIARLNSDGRLSLFCLSIPEATKLGLQVDFTSRIVVTT